MPVVRLSIDAELCGPVSIGTVAVIQALREHAGLSLVDAKALVDRCVFEGETVDVPVPSVEAGLHLLRAFGNLPEKPRVQARMTDESDLDQLRAEPLPPD